MAKSSVSKSLHVFLFIVFLLSVHEIWVEAKTCNEGLPWVETTCEGTHRSQAGILCWNECYNRHGLSATASCMDSPAVPTLFCWCSWTC